ncbi:MAG TPA: 4-hydroxyphenylpyruvate dioxygenase [Pyrinomonadaceae bacterium]|nr:4-hydroxyphenylpyruvate dioxygenase [Pyrinomonadaceae bacterium]
MPQIKEIAYVEFYVGNASQAAHFYRTAFGFQPVAKATLETGERERTSFVLRQNQITLILTSALTPASPVAEHVRTHGDSVKDIAFAVDDAAQTFAEVVKRGARPLLQPTVFEQNGARVVKATIEAFGDTVHSFIERHGDDATFLPGYQPLARPPMVKPIGLSAIDHVAVCVEPGALRRWFDFYIDVFDFRHSHQEDIVTENTAMNSGVVQNENGSIQIPIMEPAPHKSASQIEEYLAFHQGSGAQHIALLSEDILGTVRALRENGIEFLETPANYYDRLEETPERVDEDISRLRELGILLDHDRWGALLQIFTKPLHDRPTTFMEIIQRKGARGFGGGNIKALFESIEREQALRGNL